MTFNEIYKDFDTEDKGRILGNMYALANYKLNPRNAKKTIEQIIYDVWKMYQNDMKPFIVKYKDFEMMTFEEFDKCFRDN